MKQSIFFMLAFVFCGSAKSQLINSITDFKNYKPTYKLEIISYIHDTTDCGEYGGHKEILTIFKNGKVKIKYRREQSECWGVHYSPLPYSTVSNHIGFLSNEKQKLITSYLKRLQRHRPSHNLISNAPNSYEVYFSNGKTKNVFQIKDNDNSWGKYEKFRDLLLKE